MPDRESEVIACATAFGALPTGMLSFVSADVAREAIVRFGKVAGRDVEWRVLLRSFGICEANINGTIAASIGAEKEPPS